MHSVYRRLDIDAQKRRYAYQELYRNGLSTEELHEIREALNQELVLGREDFKDQIEQMTRRQSRPGRPRVKEGAVVYYLY